MSSNPALSAPHPKFYTHLPFFWVPREQERQASASENVLYEGYRSICLKKKEGFKVETTTRVISTRRWFRQQRWCAHTRAWQYCYIVRVCCWAFPPSRLSSVHPSSYCCWIIFFFSFLFFFLFIPFKLKDNALQVFSAVSFICAPNVFQSAPPPPPPLPPYPTNQPNTNHCHRCYSRSTLMRLQSNNHAVKGVGYFCKI